MFFREAVLANAAKIVLCHNHPTGDPSPSQKDLMFTELMVSAGEIMRIDVVDHLIIGHKTKTRSIDFVSMRRMGMINPKGAKK